MASNRKMAQKRRNHERRQAIVEARRRRRRRGGGGAAPSGETERPPGFPPFGVLTIPTGHPGDDDQPCPICEAMGIDLGQVDGIAWQAVPPEDWERLARAFAEVEARRGKTTVH